MIHTRKKFKTEPAPPPSFAIYHSATEDKGVFFRDGKRRIDFILSYQVGRTEEHTSEFAEQVRKAFHDSLIRENLHLEIEIHSDPTGGAGQVGFVKVHATWTALSKYAEVLRIRMPIEYFGETKESAALLQSIEAQGDGCCNSFMAYDRNALPDGPDYFSAPFSRPYETLFRIKDKEEFFTSAQRIRIVWHILSEAHFGSGHLDIGIQRLLAKSLYTAAFPLHDGPATHCILKPNVTTCDGSDPKENVVDSSAKQPVQHQHRPHNRYLLYKHWASFSQMLKTQPIDAVRDYFGEKIGIYFAWIGNYTKNLCYLAIVGLIVFIYGAVTATNDETVNAVCHRNLLGCVVMCPLCNDGCGYWSLYSSCMSSVYSHLCDNVSTIAYAVCITVWATVFIEMWSRREMVLRYEWDIYDYEDRELPRPEFEAKASTTRVDPLTGEPEPYEPLSFRILRGLASWTIIAVLILVVIGTMISVIIYRTVLNSTFFVSSVDSEFLEQYGRLLISLSAAVINLIVILILSNVYEWLAFNLTEWERPRTQSEFEDSFTVKMFIFQFANCYGTIFYTAFFRGRFQTVRIRDSMSPGMQHFMDLVSDQCDPAGCMADLSLQLAIVMVGRQIASFFMELVFPCLMKRRHKLKGLFHKKKANQANRLATKYLPENSVQPIAMSENSSIPRWEADFYLVDYTQSGILFEYLEMVLQFGFVTLFGVCFPLSPLFALLNNTIEIRMDAYKLVTNYRRPVAAMTEGIGIWLDILRCLNWIAIMSNALIIAFTSENVSRIAYDMGFGTDRLYQAPPPPTFMDQNETFKNVTFTPTRFTFLMSVMSASNVTTLPMKKFTQDKKCLASGSEVADQPSMGGFALQNMTVIDNNGTIPYCYYRGNYQPPWAEDAYEYTVVNWQLLVFRLAFALSFIVVVWVLAWLISHAIPHRPEKVRLLQRHEQRLHERALLRATEVRTPETHRKNAARLNSAVIPEIPENVIVNA